MFVYSPLIDDVTFIFSTSFGMVVLELWMPFHVSSAARNKKKLGFRGEISFGVEEGEKENFLECDCPFHSNII